MAKMGKHLFVASYFLHLLFWSLTVQGAGRNKVFHQANIVERLKNLLLSGPAGQNKIPFQ